MFPLRPQTTDIQIRSLPITTITYLLQSNFVMPMLPHNILGSKKKKKKNGRLKYTLFIIIQQKQFLQGRNKFSHFLIYNCLISFKKITQSLKNEALIFFLKLHHLPLLITVTRGTEYSKES